MVLLKQCSEWGFSFKIIKICNEKLDFSKYRKKSADNLNKQKGVRELWKKER